MMAACGSTAGDRERRSPGRFVRSMAQVASAEVEAGMFTRQGPAGSPSAWLASAVLSESRATVHDGLNSLIGLECAVRRPGETSRIRTGGLAHGMADRASFRLASFGVALDVPSRIRSSCSATCGTIWGTSGQRREGIHRENIRNSGSPSGSGTDTFEWISADARSGFAWRSGRRPGASSRGSFGGCWFPSRSAPCSVGLRPCGSMGISRRCCSSFSGRGAAVAVGVAGGGGVSDPRCRARGSRARAAGIARGSRGGPAGRVR